MNCFIFCSSLIEDYSFLENIDFSAYFIICADGGYQHAIHLGLTPDVWIGDNDSLKSKDIIADKIFTYPSEKDKTDTQLSIEYALKNGYMNITIIGGLGGRIDHEYSHFCMLKYILDNGGQGKILDKKNEITMINNCITLSRDDKHYISLYPFGGDVTGVTAKGLKYPLDDFHLPIGDTRGGSNEFVSEKEAYISIKSGYLLIIKSND